MPDEMAKNGSFSLIERVILSAGAMLIFSVYFQIDQMPVGEGMMTYCVYVSFVAMERRRGCWSRKAADGTWSALAESIKRNTVRAAARRSEGVIDLAKSAHATANLAQCCSVEEQGPFDFINLASRAPQKSRTRIKSWWRRDPQRGKRTGFVVAKLALERPSQQCFQAEE
jgi:hypothetical protein